MIFWMENSIENCQYRKWNSNKIFKKSIQTNNYILWINLRLQKKKTI